MIFGTNFQIARQGKQKYLKTHIFKYSKSFLIDSQIDFGVTLYQDSSYAEINI
jgi:hypothetical protein